MNCLCKTMNWDMPAKSITQIIEVSYNDTTVTYTIERDPLEGNITCWDKHFQLLPYIENGGVHYDTTLTVLNEVFDKSDPIDFDNIDQFLWDLDEKSSCELPVTLPHGEYVVEFSVVENIIEPLGGEIE